MPTTLVVSDGKLTNEELGALQRKINEITRRLNEGTLDHSWVLKQLQRVVEGKVVVKPAAKKSPVVTPPPATTLLELVKTVQLPAIEAFSAKECFKKGTNDGVSISFIGDNFKALFLNGSGKIELDVPVTEVRIHRLLKGSVDGPIMTELGGDGLIETTLAQFWFMLRKQGARQSGDLLTDGKANIFYIKDDAGTTWAVYAYWRDDGWLVGANPVADPDDWRAGHQVVSR